MRQRKHILICSKKLHAENYTICSEVLIWIIYMAAKAGDSWLDQKLVFTNATGGILSYRTVYDCFKRIVRQMGLPQMRFHDLRHSYAVISIKSGDDIKTIQSNLGHSSAAFTLDVYGHCTEEMKKASANRMESYMKVVMKQ